MSQCTARTMVVPMEVAVWPSSPAETTPVTAPWDGQENYAQHVRYEHICLWKCHIPGKSLF